MTARCASATNPVAPGTASVILAQIDAGAVPDETTHSIADERRSAHRGFVGDHSNYRTSAMGVRPCPVSVAVRAAKDNGSGFLQCHRAPRPLTRAVDGCGRFGSGLKSPAPTKRRTKEVPMARYMFIARYASGGVKGVVTAGGSARRAAIQKMAEELGGRLETFDFAFGEDDVYA